MAHGEYGVTELARLAGVSVRTLHHYDQIGLLVPRRLANGYRAYAERDLERLQLILLYRACGMELARIGQVLDEPGFDALDALEGQLRALREERSRIDALIATVERTIESTKEGAPMADKERFEGMRRAAISENEREHGREVRTRWGDEAMDEANAALAAMDEGTWNDMVRLEAQVRELLAAAMATGDPTGEAAAALVRAHARWIELHWGPGRYSPEAHRGLADGYLADKRFVAYYDGASGPGATKFLRDAIHALT